MKEWLIFDDDLQIQSRNVGGLNIHARCSPHYRLVSAD